MAQSGVELKYALQPGPETEYSESCLYMGTTGQSADGGEQSKKGDPKWGTVGASYHTSQYCDGWCCNQRPTYSFEVQRELQDDYTHTHWASQGVFNLKHTYTHTQSFGCEVCVGVALLQLMLDFQKLRGSLIAAPASSIDCCGTHLQLFPIC